MFTEGRIEQQIEIRIVNLAYNYETNLPAILGLSFSFTEVAFGTPVLYFHLFLLHLIK
jgi:hypothetical protein